MDRHQPEISSLVVIFKPWVVHRILWPKCFCLFVSRVEKQRNKPLPPTTGYVVRFPTLGEIPGSTHLEQNGGASPWENHLHEHGISPARLSMFVFGCKNRQRESCFALRWGGRLATSLQFVRSARLGGSRLETMTLL